MKRGVFIALAIISTLNLWGQQFPYQNPGLSSEERARDLISRLTLSEKGNLDVRCVRCYPAPGHQEI